MSGSTLTEAEIVYLNNKFDAFTKGNGLTKDVLREIYKVAQIPVTEHELDAQIRAADSKGHGKLDFDDFLTVMDKQHAVNSEEGVARVFELLDEDKDGQINGDDLKRGVSLFGKSVTDEDIEQMITSADVDGDGLINYEEFLKVMTPSKINGQPSF